MTNTKVNAYEDKKGKKYLVIQRDNEKPIFINYGLLDYALKNIKKVKEK